MLPNPENLSSEAKSTIATMLCGVLNSFPLEGKIAICKSQNIPVWAEADVWYAGKKGEIVVNLETCPLFSEAVVLLSRSYGNLTPKIGGDTMREA